MRDVSTIGELCEKIKQNTFTTNPKKNSSEVKSIEKTSFILNMSKESNSKALTKKAMGAANKKRQMSIGIRSRIGIA